MTSYITKALTLIALIITPLAFTATAQTTVSQGTSWENVGKKTSGAWSITERDGIYYVELYDNFKTKKAPDLKIYLSTADASSLGDQNGIDDATFISALSKNKGKQSYPLPAELDPADFASLVIYCEAYTKFWAATSL